MRLYKFVIAIAVMAGVLCGCRKDENEAVNYEQETSEDGIAYDLSDNEYFMNKISGYEYSSPKRIEYYSDITDTNRHARVLLPADYDEDKEYPVLYLLHGLGGSDKTWINKDADIIVQNLHYLNDTPEWITVFVNCNVNEEESVDGLEWPDSVAAFDGICEDMINNLMPYIEENYSVKTGRENTAIAGYSLGGRETLHTAFLNQDRFAYAGAFSLVSPLDNGYIPGVLEDFTIDEGSDGFELLLINVGEDDPYIQGTYEVTELLTANNIDYIYYIMAGAHENSVWQNALYNFGLRLFTEN